MSLLAELQEWDPLLDSPHDASLADEMKRQEIRNILRSYTGFYDLFSELIQNSLDSVDSRAAEETSSYRPTIWIHVDIRNQYVSVTDNGLGLSEDHLRLFLQPNMSFKKKGNTRGEKGVGATFLAYGFNYLQIATRTPDFSYVGVLENGRAWVEDKDKVYVRPRIKAGQVIDPVFNSIDQGASFVVKLSGDKVRPKDLSWIGANSAEQWDVVLRIKTPLGGIYIGQTSKPKIVCNLKVTDSSGIGTEKTITDCEYLYPHSIPGRHLPLNRLIQHQEKSAQAGRPVVWPPEFSRLTSIFDSFSADAILDGTAAIKPQLDKRQRELMQEHKPDVYVFFVYSTQFWDDYNDRRVGLRQKNRILRGGLQLATQGMPQGDLLTIPLTQSTGYQNTTHVIVHFYNAEPDLGRKGFQPELVSLAETLSTASVTAFKRWSDRLRKDTGQPHLFADAEKYQWITQQELHEREAPLIISGPGLFAPEEVIPITSTPLHEQGVIALFNQLLAAGVIRGFRILATSSHERYDGVVKIHTEKTDKYLYNARTNPLGIPGDNLTANTTAPMVLEYKYVLDAILNDFSREIKFENHVDLVVAWTMGEKWKEKYQVIPLLHENYIYNRFLHGITHDLLDASSGVHVFYAIILDELVRYIENPRGTQEELYQKYLLEDY